MFRRRKTATSMDQLDQCSRLLLKYAHLFQTHLVTFFTDEHPLEPWFDMVGRYSDIATLPRSGSIPESWPDDLKRYLFEIREMIIPGLIQSPIPDPQVPDIAKWKVLMKGMALKKRTEVLAMCSLVYDVCKATNTMYCVDIGAGQGYLGSALALFYGIRVVGIEASSSQVKEHEARWAKIVAKFPDVSGLCSVVHCEYTDCQSFDELNKLVQTTLGKDQFVVCGLHTCGDLASTTLRWMMEDCVCGGVSLGCCYNLLSETGPDLSDPRYIAYMDDATSSDPLGWGDEIYHIEESEVISGDNWTKNNTYAAPRRQLQSTQLLPGFPLSRPDLKLGIRARALACQSVVRWGSEFEWRDGVWNSSTFNKDYWRAVLHGALVKEIGSRAANRVVIGKVRCKDLTLQSYTEKCMEVANPKAVVEKISSDFVSRVVDLELTFRRRKHSMMGYWALRTALAPLIESYILMDRQAYLINGVPHGEVSLVPVCDPKISPRNVAVVLKKLIYVFTINYNAAISLQQTKRLPNSARWWRPCHQS